MKMKVVLSVFTFLLIATTIYAAADVPTISQGDEEGPIITLPFDEGGEVYLAVYQDFQNSFTYNPSVEVQDPDGIDTVLFLYRPLGNDSWYTTEAQLESGNDTAGTYRAPFTWYETGVEFKVTATDMLGYTTESGSIFYLIDPFAIHPSIMFLATIPIMVILFLWMRRKR